jgi:mRNA-degrading endonuclease RelE of RelBE toxin-antitoxin system
MAHEPLPVEFTPEFKRNLRQLAKKYPHIRADIQPVLDEISEGKEIGDRIVGVRYQVYKARAKNSDARKGKSGGYRIIFQIKPGEKIVLVTIYSKTEQSDVAALDIRRIVSDFESSNDGNRKGDA